MNKKKRLLPGRGGTGGKAASKESSSFPVFLIASFLMSHVYIEVNHKRKQ